MVREQYEAADRGGSHNGTIIPNPTTVARPITAANTVVIRNNLDKENCTPKCPHMDRYRYLPQQFAQRDAWRLPNAMRRSRILPPGVAGRHRARVSDSEVCHCPSRTSHCRKEGPRRNDQAAQWDPDMRTEGSAQRAYVVSFKECAFPNHIGNHAHDRHAGSRREEDDSGEIRRFLTAVPWGSDCGPLSPLDPSLLPRGFIIAQVLLGSGTAASADTGAATCFAPNATHPLRVCRSRLRPACPIGPASRHCLWQRGGQAHFSPLKGRKNEPVPDP